jgi:hypothetical protein
MLQLQLHSHLLLLLLLGYAPLVHPLQYLLLPWTNAAAAAAPAAPKCLTCHWGS